MATTRADVYADDATMRATKALQRYQPVRRERADVMNLATNALTDLRHWCESRGLDFDDVMHQVEFKYQRDRAGRPAGDDDSRRDGCTNCKLVGAACEEHQTEVPGR